MSDQDGPARAAPDGERDIDAEQERQRASLTWALADLDGLLARGVLDAGTAETLRRDYAGRLRHLAPAWPGAQAAGPTQATLPLDMALAPAPVATAPAAPPAAPETPPLPPAPAPPHPPRDASAGEYAVAPAPAQPAAAGVTGLWINLLLFLGAFFVVMASLIFVISSWRLLGAGAKAGIMLAFTAAFIGGGLLCVRLPRVRPAGHTFLAIGAVLVPLDIIGGYNFFLRDQGVSAATTWALGSACCALFYGALTLGGLGRAYGVAALVATISAWIGMLVAAGVPAAWFAAAFLALPLLLLLAGGLLERTAPGRAAFGPLPIWAAHLLVPAGGLLILAAVGADSDRWGVPLALLEIVAFYALAAVGQPREVLRTFHVAGASGAGALLFPALAWLAHLAPRWYAATTLGGAWLALVIAVALLWRGGAAWRVAGYVVLAAAWCQVGALLLPWGFFVGEPAVYWALIFAGCLLFAAVQIRWLRQPLLLYPLAQAVALVLFHLLRIGPHPGLYGYAWAYALLTLVPIAGIDLARRQGLSRRWDWQLAIISQAYAIAATVLALRADNPFQITAILWLFVVASGAIVALERRAELLVLPNLWALGATAATLNLAGAGPRWAPATFSAIGLVLAIGLQGWRGVHPDRRSEWFVAHRWMAGAWAVSGPLLALVFLAPAIGDFLTTGQLLPLVLDHAYGPAGLAVSLCAAALGADAIMTLRRPTGYSASAMLALAVLMGIARITPNNPQAYAVPLGLYLLVLSIYVAYERDLGPVRMPAANALMAGAVFIILGTTFAQSLVHPWHYVPLGLAEGLALLAATVFLRRKYGVALSLVFLTLLTLRAVFDVARSLPNWALIGLLGLVLLGSGVFVLLRRDRLEDWGSAAAQRWARLM